MARCNRWSKSTLDSPKGPHSAVRSMSEATTSADRRPNLSSPDLLSLQDCTSRNGCLDAFGTKRHPCTFGIHGPFSIHVSPAICCAQMNPNLQIVWIEDLLRPSAEWLRGYCDLLREPILQGCGLRLGEPAGTGKASSLRGFDPEVFRSLVPPPSSAEPWAWQFREIPGRALEYLDSAIADDALVLSFEMPPWLSRLCERRGIAFLDIQCSPLKFGRDLYIAIRTGVAEYQARIAEARVRDEEIRLEAGTLIASIRMQQARFDAEGRYPLELDGSLIFIGQAPFDSSVVGDDGRPLRCGDYAERVLALSKNRRLLYKPHPMAPWFADEERRALEAIAGKNVPVCLHNAYQILCTADVVELAAISSGLLQEASYFGKRAHMLFRPRVPLAAPGYSADRSTFQQVHFDDFVSPGFWHRLLTPGREPPIVNKLPAKQANQMRETVDFWWDYAKVMTWQRTLWLEAFERSGGGLLRSRIENLEKAAWPADGVQRHGSGI